MRATACARSPQTWPSVTSTRRRTDAWCRCRVERSVAAAPGRHAERRGVGIRFLLALARGIDGHPAAAAHARVVELAVTRARRVIAAEFFRRVFLIELHPLPVVA